MSMLHTIILSIVEGLTEFLPVSSTGHMIIVSWFLGINEVQFVKDFTVIVQFGAILSVLVLYWRRFLVSYPFYLKLLVAFLPAAIIGLAVKKKIDILLGDVRVVGWALVGGGIVLLFVDRFFAKQERELEARGEGHIATLTYVQALIIGVSQCAAFIPGMSRSASSIIGGLGTRLNRRAAAEFSFFLAVPTLTAATAYKCLKIYPTLTSAEIPVLVWGNLIAFVVGCLAIRTFVNFLTKHGFFLFGVYRIIIGAILLILIAMGKGITDV